MKTLFASILQGCGLSQSEAAEFLAVRQDTIAKWSAGKGNAPKGVLALLAGLADAETAVGEALVAAWLAAGGPEDFAVPLLPGLDNLPPGARIAAIRRGWERMAPGTRVFSEEP